MKLLNRFKPYTCAVCGRRRRRRYLDTSTCGVKCFNSMRTTLDHEKMRRRLDSTARGQMRLQRHVTAGESTIWLEPSFLANNLEVGNTLLIEPGTVNEEMCTVVSVLPTPEGVGVGVVRALPPTRSVAHLSTSPAKLS